MIGRSPHDIIKYFLQLAAAGRNDGHWLMPCYSSEYWVGKVRKFVCIDCAPLFSPPFGGQCTSNNITLLSFSQFRASHYVDPYLYQTNTHKPIFKQQRGFVFTGSCCHTTFQQNFLLMSLGTRTEHLFLCLCCSFPIMLGKHPPQKPCAPWPPTPHLPLKKKNQRTL